jgi:hypothetical protein
VEPAADELQHIGLEDAVDRDGQEDRQAGAPRDLLALRVIQLGIVLFVKLDADRSAEAVTNSRKNGLLGMPAPS